MKKFKILALLATFCVMGTVFAAGWTFGDTSSSDKASTITGTIAEAQTAGLDTIGTWSTDGQITVNYENTNEDGSGYGVKAVVAGQITYTFQVTDSKNYSIVDTISGAARINSYAISAGNVEVTSSLSTDSNVVTITKDKTAGTVVIVVPASAITLTVSGAFTKHADYTEFKEAVTGTSLIVTASVASIA